MGNRFFRENGQKLYGEWISSKEWEILDGGYSMTHNRRNSGFELLRIISMYMIVLIHANMYLPQFCEGSARVFYNGFVNGICNIGVTCFILISGYFGVNFNLKKLLKMECMMISFSILETVMILLVMPQELQGAALLEQIVKSCMPFVTRKYWFYSCYICLLIFSKYINQFVDSLEQEDFRKLLVVLLIIFSVFPTLFYFEIIPDNGKGFFQMLIIYLLGRYIGRFGMQHIGRLSKAARMVVFSLLWILNGISHEIPINPGGIYHHLCKDNSITNIAMALLLLSFVKEWDFQSRFINTLSKYVFAIFALNNTMVTIVMYLLQESDLLHPSGWPGGPILFLIVGGIMVVCLFLGAVRELVLGRTENKIINFLCGRVERWTK